MTIIDILSCLGIGVGIGTCIGLTGTGGGILVVPILVLGLGLGSPVAVATANVFSFFSKCSGVFAHGQNKNIDWRNGSIFLLSAIPGTMLAAWCNSYWGANAAYKYGLNWFIVAITILAGVLIGRSYLARHHSGTTRITVEKPQRIKIAHLWAFLTGLLIGGTGVGGGVMVIPILTGCFCLPMKRTVGTSIYIAVVLTLVSTAVSTLTQWFGHATTSGNAIGPDWGTAVMMSVGAIGGVTIGARFHEKMTEKTLHKWVIGMIVLASVMMLIKAITA